MPPAVVILFFLSVIGSIGFCAAWISARRRALRAEARLRELPAPVADPSLMQAIEAVAVEVERLGEGQRYLTRVAAEGTRAASAGREMKDLRTGARAPGEA